MSYEFWVIFSPFTSYSFYTSFCGCFNIISIKKFSHLMSFRGVKRRRISGTPTLCYRDPSSLRSSGWQNGDINKMCRKSSFTRGIWHFKFTTFSPDYQVFPSVYRAVSRIIYPHRYQSWRKVHRTNWSVVSLYCHRKLIELTAEALEGFRETFRRLLRKL